MGRCLALQGTKLSVRAEKNTGVLVLAMRIGRHTSLPNSCSPIGQEGEDRKGPKGFRAGC